jgi:hypothetical protein
MQREYQICGRRRKISWMQANIIKRIRPSARQRTDKKSHIETIFDAEIGDFAEISIKTRKSQIDTNVLI